MFTGIVTDVGTVRKRRAARRPAAEIATGYDLGTVDLGASIACSGVCLTVVDKGDDWFAVDVSGETVSRTAADLWREGARLNLERSLRMGDELGGHIVTGHVDAVGEVVGTCPEGDSTRVGLSVPRALGADDRGQGLDRARRRVADRQRRARCRGRNDPFLGQHHPPHRAADDLRRHRPGRQLNVEVDVLARYIERMLAARAQ